MNCLSEKDILVSIRDLSVFFGSGGSPLKAVDGVSLDIPRGTIVAIAGESGCGKTVTALSIGRLLPNSAWHAGGSVRVAGDDVFAMRERDLPGFRGDRLSYIFQEAGAALNPVRSIGSQVKEAFRGRLKGAEADRRVHELLAMVEIDSPLERAGLYPHELSGGMQQRVMIAMALAGDPELLIADEPTTALDVTVQAGIMKLLVKLQAARGLTVLMITHNLGLLSGVASFVYVMYAGRIVESGPAAEILFRPAHHYTIGLVAASPRLSGADGARLEGIPGRLPDIGNLPAGCKFAPRCKAVRPECTVSEPPLRVLAGNRCVRCHFPAIV